MSSLDFGLYPSESLIHQESYDMQPLGRKIQNQKSVYCWRCKYMRVCVFWELEGNHSSRSRSTVTPKPSSSRYRRRFLISWTLSLLTSSNLNTFSPQSYNAISQRHMHEGELPQPYCLWSLLREEGRDQLAREGAYLKEDARQSLSKDPNCHFIERFLDSSRRSSILYSR